MANEMMTKVEGNEIILERVFDAPQELVFQAFTEAEHLKHWWGPRGWTLTACHVDFRPGGVWHYCMKCMDENQGDFYGMESWGKGVYQEIDAPAAFSYIDYFSDADGNESQELPATHVAMSFVDEAGKTKLISISRYESEEALKTVLEMGMEQGIKETWDRLGEHLDSVRQ
ncbi:SRPBCC domain-containing protein [Paenibacillus sp. IB182496]|uniref:SRPBCC domain-containing protein n=1 Tax=Paenibacillus sabuli TaxID=2772509 RepID=A0A927BV92_9BACL|nr:SRPBCC domain-containing protein [Paenibacillus sabuli]MBD2846295.1 SRPBCC domain-containing protein [Paenibacillus sabuli]